MKSSVAAPSLGANAPVSSREIEERVSRYWNETRVIARALEDRPGRSIFRFTEGPPTANGAPHMGHLVQRILKDLALRYHRAKGERILSPMAGWDCHGLPVELQVEKQIGLKSKQEIEHYGVARFSDACRTEALTAAGLFVEMSRRIGFWLDYDRAYFTMDPKYIESVWWSLKTLFERGLLEKGHYVLPYCPRCETPLSSHEVAQGYREATDPSVTVRFPLVGEESRRRSLLVWTTTPWTLPANLLVAAHPDLIYVTVATPEGEELILAESALERYHLPATEIRERIRGSDLAGREYRPPFSWAGYSSGRYRVVTDESVTATDGTGLVHISPSFGPEDQRIGEAAGVGSFDPLDSRGRFTEAVPPVRGKFFKTADPILTRDLEERGLLYESTTLRHTYPFCWRCETPLLYRAIDSWFLRTRRLTDRLVVYNQRVEWIPAHLRDGRFGNFLTEAKDWALSRNRYWGTPLPLWVCPQGHVTCIGSFAELADRTGAPLPEGFDPHRVGVDRLAVRCSVCQDATRREPYTLDTWYDSGCAPFAQYHYPFESGRFDPTMPLDFIAEGLDQTRGWFYTMHVLSTALFDRPAFRRVLVNGMVLDENGRKMSKSKGNAVDPLELLNQVGGDAVRWTFLAVDFTEPMRFTPAMVQTGGARFLRTLHNVAAFYLQNSRAGGVAWDGRPVRPAGALDRWILSRLEATRESVDRALNAGDPRPAVPALTSLLDDLSHWYLRRSRPRFWSEEETPDRQDAYATLGSVLDGVARLLAPMLPFTAEWIHQEVTRSGWDRAETSVHLASWPEELAPRDPALETAMDLLRAEVERARLLRQRAEVKSRIPLAELALADARPTAWDPLGEEADRLLAEELNVKRVRWQVAPSSWDDREWVVAREGDRAVAALPRRPTPELAREGLLRELLRRIQQARKEAHLDYSDRIDLLLAVDPPTREAVELNRDRFLRDLLVRHLDFWEGPIPDGPLVFRWPEEGIAWSAQITRVPS
jgi:isoleucyl-tRNA synthetase